MSSLNLSRRAVVAGMLAVAACGFTPVYGPKGPGRALMGQIRPDQPNSQDDFYFTRQLTEMLGNGERGTYRLSYRLRIAALAQAITPDQITTRQSLNGTATYALTDQTGAVIAKGQVSNFTSYSAIGTTVATMAGETDARQRLAAMLADQVVTQLYASIPETGR